MYVYSSDWLTEINKIQYQHVLALAQVTNSEFDGLVQPSFNLF